MNNVDRGDLMLLSGLVCLVIAAASVAPALGWAVLGAGLVALAVLRELQQLRGQK